ncbi:DNA binding protein [Phytophthora megakarya]|uniref:DNA binding protein n=1 Tax=Phytophthora megakarya TaxID=4795 RepID=A0A225V7E0_9STRA|nr:DNA binding protein [Phytophthora megakarya]
MQNAVSDVVEWTLDAASDCHLCTNKDLLSNTRKNDGPLVFDWENKPARNKGLLGEVRLRVANENKPKAKASIGLSSVLYTPTGMNNLLSLNKLEQGGWEFTKLKGQNVAWLQKGSLLLKLMKSRGRYRLQTQVLPVHRVIAMAQTSSHDNKVLMRWHTRFGHLHYGALQRVVREGDVDGMDLDGHVSAPSERCWTCVQSRIKRMSNKSVDTTRSTRMYHKLMSDMCYVDASTYDGYFHFQLVQDEASRYVWGFLLKRKEEACSVVTRHLEWLLAQGHHIEVFVSDEGRELVNKTFRAFLRSKGVELNWTNSYSPEENGLVEKMNGVVLSRVRSMLTTVDLPDLLWGEAFACAVEVRNVSPSCARAGETPYTRCFRERPDKVLRKSKLENPDKPGIFLGYAQNSISYRVMDLKSGKVRELRTVEFAEDWTVERSYVKILLLNCYAKGKNKLPSQIPFVRLDGWRSSSTERLPDAQLPDVDGRAEIHRDKRHCTEDLRKSPSIVVGTPTTSSGLASSRGPVGGVLSENPTGTAEAGIERRVHADYESGFQHKIMQALMEEAVQKMA